MRQRYAAPAFLVLASVFVGFRLLAVDPWIDPFFDLHAYWTTRDGLAYELSTPFTIGAYLYSPAFAQGLRPLSILPWPLFAAAWTGLIFAILLWLSGRWALIALFAPPVALSVVLGQVDLFIAAAIVLGFRFPAAWALVLLTKVTPGIGLLWFLVRREWRALWLAFGGTLGVVAVSAALDPGGWAAWLDFLRRSLAVPPLEGGAYLALPLWLRLPVAAAIVAWGARTDRRWTVPVGAVLAMPVLWFNPLAVLVAILPLIERGRATPAAAWLRAGVLIGSVAGAARRARREAASPRLG